MTVSAANPFRLILLLILFWGSVAAARGPSDPEEQKIHATISRWYEELEKKDEGRVWDLVGPGFIDASPHRRYVDNGSRALGPPIYDSLAAQALKFAWEIDVLRRDSTFAKVQVWERGYFYAWAAEKTYERAASTTFILERREADGRWLILAHESSSIGIPPNKITDPMPDLRELYEATVGEAPARKPAAPRRRFRSQAVRGSSGSGGGSLRGRARPAAATRRPSARAQRPSPWPRPNKLAAPGRPPDSRRA